MQQPLMITFRGMAHSDAVEGRIQAKATELERFYDGITSCHVTVDAKHRHHHKGNLYSVHVNLHVPGKELVIGRERRHDHSHEDVYVALRDTFDAARRQLEDYARMRRGKVKRHEAPDHARVNKLFRVSGYGFVSTEDGTEVYFHENSVPEGGFASLEVGDEVRVVVAEGEGEKGPQASTVIRAGRQASPNEKTA